MTAPTASIPVYESLGSEGEHAARIAATKRQYENCLGPKSLSLWAPKFLFSMRAGISNREARDSVVEWHRSCSCFQHVQNDSDRSMDDDVSCFAGGMGSTGDLRGFDGARSARGLGRKKRGLIGWGL